jgi:cytochrome b pre-mRNA-processing protein 3
MSMIFKLFRKSVPDDAVYSTYSSIVAQSRQPRFYADWGVPDTVTGRFDMISLHVVLMLRRLRSDTAARDLGQALVDFFFRDMDRSLRELGAGDLTIPKKVRNMSKLFYGLATALEPCLASGDTEGIAAVLRKNVYGGTDAPGAPELARYLVATAAEQAAKPISAFVVAPAGGVA